MCKKKYCLPLLKKGLCNRFDVGEHDDFLIRFKEYFLILKFRLGEALNFNFIGPSPD
jgi:hypothetical protein